MGEKKTVKGLTQSNTCFSRFEPFMEIEFTPELSISCKGFVSIVIRSVSSELLLTKGNSRLAVSQRFNGHRHTNPCTEKNVTTLKRAYPSCDKWSQCHTIRFCKIKQPEKYPFRDKRSMAAAAAAAASLSGKLLFTHR